MTEWWINPNGFLELFFFSPMCEKTNLWDNDLKLQKIVTREDLIEFGWQESEAPHA